MLELIRQAERVQMVKNGVVMVDAIVRGDRVEGRLTDESGATGDILLEGVCDERGFRLSGRGRLLIGPISLADAAVQVEPSGVSVTWTVPWPDGPAIGSFEMADEPATWRGRLDGRHTLRCLMTRSEVLRTSITFDIQSTDGPPSSAALAVLDGRNIDVPLGDAWWSGLDGGWSTVRAATLAAVAAYLRQELATTEARFAKASSDENGDSDAERRGVAPREVGALLAAEERGAPRSTPSSTAAGSYLPARSARTDRSQRTTISPNGGSLPAAPFAASADAVGYVGPIPRNTSRARAMSVGYLPSSARSSGYLPSSTTGDQRQRFNRIGTDAVDPPASVMPRGHTGQAYVDVERISYALLRCKDLLQAVDAARAQDVGNRAG